MAARRCGEEKAAKAWPWEGSEERTGTGAVLCKFAKFEGIILSFCPFFVRRSMSASSPVVNP